MRVIPVSKLKAKQLKAFLLETIDTVSQNGGTPVALIGDNCGVNKGCYALMGGPGIIQYKGTSTQKVIHKPDSLLLSFENRIT